MNIDLSTMNPAGLVAFVVYVTADTANGGFNDVVNPSS